MSGALLLPRALLRGREVDQHLLITVDIFETLLTRLQNEGLIWSEGASRVFELARKHGVHTSSDAMRFRRAVEDRLSEEAINNGVDPEFSHREVFEAMLHGLGAGDWRNDASRELSACELRLEEANTKQIATTVSWIRSLIETGTRVVAISDSRYTASELAQLLSAHGIVGLSAIYSSADHQASKFSGKLYDIVAKFEGVNSRQIVHIGNDIIVDCLSAAQRGYSVRPMQSLRAPSFLPVGPQCPDCDSDAAFSLGYKSIGPVLVAFQRLLFSRATRDGIQRLAFVARDGELLLQVARILAASSYSASYPELRYVQLSRRAVLGASSRLLTLDSSCANAILTQLRSIRSGSSVLESFQKLYNIPANLVDLQKRRLKLLSGEEADLHRLLSDEYSAHELTSVFNLNREYLWRYLDQEQLLKSDTALVDIGWRCSLQKVVEAEARQRGLPAPRGYYLGLWNENAGDFPSTAVGIISDQRRNSSLYEASAWHAAFLLEAVCRAKHGMVVGYKEGDNGEVCPVHLENGRSRAAERDSESVQERVQQGVLCYVRWFASTHPIPVEDEGALRREAQRTLFRLAFFPSRLEQGIGHKLIHSEPVEDQNPTFLITSPPQSVKDWINGLHSPWKGGYIAQCGGKIGAWLYCGVEWLFAQLPPGTKSRFSKVLDLDT